MSDRSDLLATVVGLRRHPVKSMQGESLELATVDERGVHGDRAYGVFDRADGRLLTGKRFPLLLGASARFVGGAVSDDALEITMPDGTVHTGVVPAVHDALSALLGRPVELRRGSALDPASTIEIELDLDDPSSTVDFQTRPGMLFDGAVVHLLSIQSLASAHALHPRGVWSVERFRPNVVVDALGGAPWPEDAWMGSPLQVGTAGLEVRRRCDRCVLVTRALPGVEADKEVLRSLAEHHDATLGLKVEVPVPGVISLGDPVVGAR